MSLETEMCEGCDVMLTNLTLEKRVLELEVRIEAIELILDAFKELLLEKVGYLTSNR